LNFDIIFQGILLWDGSAWPKLKDVSNPQVCGFCSLIRNRSEVREDVLCYLIITVLWQVQFARKFFTTHKYTILCCF